MSEFADEYIPPARSMAVPMARQNCSGASRLVEVNRWPKADKVPCTHCSLKLVGVRQVTPGDLHPETGKQRLYLILPSHLKVGEKRPDQIDWSQL